jgi:adenylate cyclase
MLTQDLTAKKRLPSARWRQYLGKVWPGTAAVLLVLVLQLAAIPLLSQLSLLVFDSYQRLVPRSYSEAPVRIVDIDDESIRKLGQWPWPRTDLARLTRSLTDAGASAVAFDIVFSEPDRLSPPRLATRLEQENGAHSAYAALAKLPDNDRVFAAALARSPAVMGYFLSHDGARPALAPKAGMALSGSSPDSWVAQYSNSIASLPELLEPALGNGFLSLRGDNDGIIRKAPMLAMQGDQLLPSLSLDALRVAQGAGSIVVKTSDGSGTGGGAKGQVVSLKVGQFEVPLTHAGELWLYYTLPHRERIVPAWKVMDGNLSNDETKRLFAGHIVFVGAGASGLRDLVSTPMQSRDLGVMVHAQAAEQMILGKFLVRPDWATGAEMALVLALGLAVAFAVPALGAMRGALVSTVLVCSTLWGSFELFRGQHFLLDPVYPMLAIICAYLVSTGVSFYREERQRAYIHSAFDRYLSPVLVKQIADNPGLLELGGEERQMTVLFCDIRKFSALSETLGPQQIIRFLIAFLTPMCDILLARKATIDKFIGDAILAFWNAPLDDPLQYENAARAALAMTARLRALNQSQDPAGDKDWPGQIGMGIGLNAGPCCVGNMGSAQRLSYSLIGDTVNLASRIEGLTKFYGVDIAVGSALHAELNHFACVEIDRVRVVGRQSPETVYALLGDEAMAATDEFATYADKHAQLINAYRDQDWQTASAIAYAIAGHAEERGLGKLIAIYAKRIRDFAKAPPPADWDGTFESLAK